MERGSVVSSTVFVLSELSVSRISLTRASIFSGETGASSIMTSRVDCTVVRIASGLLKTN